MGTTKIYIDLCTDEKTIHHSFLAFYAPGKNEKAADVFFFHCVSLFFAPYPDMLNYKRDGSANMTRNYW